MKARGRSLLILVAVVAVLFLVLSPVRASLDDAGPQASPGASTSAPVPSRTVTGSARPRTGTRPPPDASSTTRSLWSIFEDVQRRHESRRAGDGAGAAVRAPQVGSRPDAPRTPSVRSTPAASPSPRSTGRSTDGGDGLRVGFERLRSPE